MRSGGRLAFVQDFSREFFQLKTMSDTSGSSFYLILLLCFQEQQCDWISKCLIQAKAMRLHSESVTCRTNWASCVLDLIPVLLHRPRCLQDRSCTTKASVTAGRRELMMSHPILLLGSWAYCRHPRCIMTIRWILSSLQLNFIKLLM